MSPDIFVQARRVSENTGGFFLLFLQLFQFLLWNGGREGFVTLLKPTCVTTRCKDDVALSSLHMCDCSGVTCNAVLWAGSLQKMVS